MSEQSVNRLSPIYQNEIMSKNRGTSRLVKREEKKLSKQAFTFIFFGLLILILFIFVIVPNIIRFFFSVIDKETPTLQADTIPPQTPVLSAVPPEATMSASLSFTGYAEPKSKVVFLVNESETSEVDVDDQGQFTYDLHLQNGENTISLYGVDAAGNESLKTRSYQVAQDNEAPSIEIEQPADGSTIELKKNRTTTIKGKTEVGARLTLNGRSILLNADGSFSSTYYLDEGDNELTFTAVDKAGNQTEKKIKVTFHL